MAKHDSEGYVTLPSGILIQWGRYFKTTGSDGWVNITLPVPFKDKNWVIVWGLQNPRSLDGYRTVSPDPDYWTEQLFRVEVLAASNPTRNLFWIAIGAAR